jgi:hypothetical protein
MRKYVKNHGIIFGGPQNFVGFSTGPWTGKGWETLHYGVDYYKKTSSEKILEGGLCFTVDDNIKMEVRVLR